MRYSTKGNSSDLWQRILLVLLGVACVVLCYLIGAYWIGPMLLRYQQTKSPSQPFETDSPAPYIATTPAPTAPVFSPSSPKLAGLVVRERPPDSLPNEVQVVPPPASILPNSNTPTEEPEPPTRLEDIPSPRSEPPVNLWKPVRPSTSVPPPETRPGASLGDLQVPQTLDGEPAPASASPNGKSEVLYRVRVQGSFDSREQAEDLLRAVVDKGLNGSIVTDTLRGRTVFRVQLGTYRSRTNADKLAEQARQAGIDVEVQVPSP